MGIQFESFELAGFFTIMQMGVVSGLVLVNIVILCEEDLLHLPTKNGELDAVPDQVGSLRDFEELSIFVTVA